MLKVTGNDVEFTNFGAYVIQYITIHCDHTRVIVNVIGKSATYDFPRWCLNINLSSIQKSRSSRNDLILNPLQ